MVALCIYDEEEQVGQATTLMGKSMMYASTIADFLNKKSQDCTIMKYSIQDWCLDTKWMNEQEARYMMLDEIMKEYDTIYLIQPEICIASKIFWDGQMVTE